MNYYQPREIAKDGKGTGRWHYTCRNDNQIWPVGYCAQGCEGHPTPDEARAHQTAYILDHEVRLDETDSDSQRQCEAPIDGGCCGAWTQGRARVGKGIGRQFVLCGAHRTKEIVAALYGSVGDVISSY